MERLKPLDPTTAAGRTKDLFDAVKAKMGGVPNLTRVMAHSPVVLEGYLGLSGALAAGVLPPKVREQLALAVGEANGCEYCLSAHTFLGKKAGLSEDAVLDARRGTAADVGADALLRLARTVLADRGKVSDDVVRAVRDAGYGDAEIAEVIAHVALNVFTNFLNNVARTPVDFPKAAPFDHREACTSIPGCDPTR